MHNQRLSPRWDSLLGLIRLALVFLVVIVGLLPIPTAHAATYVVDRFDDTGGATACTAAPNDCSLRGAITAANTNPGADTVTLPAGTYTFTGVLKSGTVDNSLEVTDGGFGRKNARNGGNTPGFRPIPGHQRLISRQWQAEDNPDQ